MVPRACGVSLCYGYLQRGRTFGQARRQCVMGGMQ
jgi:hypothetical protein